MARLAFTLLCGIAAGLAGLVKAEDIEECGTQPYFPSQYTCYDNEFLCPIINDEATLRCGDACYTSHRYSCTDGQLTQLEPQSSPFTLTADHPGADFNGKTIEACGQRFYIGGGACTYCPTVVGWETCSSVTNTTILYAGSALATIVPGGQMYFVDPTGALGFTQAHSASYPVGSVFGVGAYEGGEFTFNQQDTWLACPVSGSPTLHQVYAQMAGVAPPAGCIGFYALTHDSPQGTYGAWQYT